MARIDISELRVLCKAKPGLDQPFLNFKFARNSPRIEPTGDQLQSFICRRRVESRQLLLRFQIPDSRLVRDAAFLPGR